jgi:hypothetical protein
MGKLHRPVGLVKAHVMWEINEFKVRAKRLEFLVT